MDKVVIELAIGIKAPRSLIVAAGDVFSGGMDDGIVVIRSPVAGLRAKCVRVSRSGLRVVDILKRRLQQEHCRLSENDAKATIRQMQRHLKPVTK